MVLADRVWPASGVLRDAVLALGGMVLLALCAQVEVPLRPVPITGQTFGVLLIGALLGARRSAGTVVGYLAMGLAGLPVFAGGGAGPAVLGGPTGGYLLGFAPAAALVGWLSARGWDRHPVPAAASMVLGSCVVHAFGLAWLSRFVGWDHVLAVGLLPFIPGDLAKVVLAALALPAGWRLLGRLPS